MHISEIELETRDPEIPPFNSPCPKSNADLRLDFLLFENPVRDDWGVKGSSRLIAFDMIGPTEDSRARYGIRDGVIDIRHFFVEVDDGRPRLGPDMLIADYVSINFDSFVGTLLDTDEDQVIDTIEVIASERVEEIDGGELFICDGSVTTDLIGDVDVVVRQ